MFVSGFVFVLCVLFVVFDVFVVFVVFVVCVVVVVVVVVFVVSVVCVVCVVFVCFVGWMFLGGFVFVCCFWDGLVWRGYLLVVFVKLWWYSIGGIWLVVFCWWMYLLLCLFCWWTVSVWFFNGLCLVVVLFL